MAAVDQSGIERTTLAQYKTLLETRYRAAFGDDVALSSETPLGQIVGV